MVEMFLQQALENSKNQSYDDPDLLDPSDEGQIVTTGSEL
jgi:hypothetical protein